MRDVSDIQSVLFVCSFNVVRSPIAEILLKQYCGVELYVQSAGVHEGAEQDVFAIATMKEAGLDLSKHHPRSFQELDEGGFDLIIALSEEAYHFAIEQSRTESVDIEFWPTYDATSTTGSRDLKMAAYREVRDQLDAKIKDRFAKWLKI